MPGAPSANGRIQTAQRTKEGRVVCDGMSAKIRRPVEALVGLCQVGLEALNGEEYGRGADSISHGSD
jgi:hypothetical protein